MDTLIGLAIIVTIYTVAQFIQAKREGKAPFTAGMRINCTHCQAKQKVPNDEPPEFTCSNCGGVIDVKDAIS